MARLALKNKTAGRKIKADKERAAGKKVTFPTRIYNRCEVCGRVKGYMRRFHVCRICFRMMARDAKIPGVTHSSW